MTEIKSIFVYQEHKRRTVKRVMWKPFLFFFFGGRGGERRGGVGRGFLFLCYSWCSMLTLNASHCLDVEICTWCLFFPQPFTATHQTGQSHGIARHRRHGSFRRTSYKTWLTRAEKQDCTGVKVRRRPLFSLFCLFFSSCKRKHEHLQLLQSWGGNIANKQSYCKQHAVTRFTQSWSEMHFFLMKKRVATPTLQWTKSTFVQLQSIFEVMHSIRFSTGFRGLSYHHGNRFFLKNSLAMDKAEMIVSLVGVACWIYTH